jgi:hypothetical protein
MIEIRPADIPEDLAEVRALFREYADGVGVDLCFQGFEAELAELPGKYAAPTGRLLLAWRGTEVVGAVALRGLDDDTCEMKRLYVRPTAGESNSVGGSPSASARRLAKPVIRASASTRCPT